MWWIVFSSWGLLALGFLMGWCFCAFVAANHCSECQARLSFGPPPEV